MILETPKVYHVDATRVYHLTSISDLEFASKDKSMVDCVIMLKEFGLEPLPFTAFKFDSMAHGREIYNDILSGVFGEIAPYKPRDEGEL